MLLVFVSGVVVRVEVAVRPVVMCRSHCFVSVGVTVTVLVLMLVGMTMDQLAMTVRVVVIMPVPMAVLVLMLQFKHLERAGFLIGQGQQVQLFLPLVGEKLGG